MKMAAMFGVALALAVVLATVNALPKHNSPPSRYNGPDLQKFKGGKLLTGSQEVKYRTQPLFLSTMEEYNHVLATTENKMVVVFFTAFWCGKCVTADRDYNKMPGEFTDIVFYKVDVDANIDAATAAGIQDLPTFILYYNGKKIDAVVGGADALRTMLSNYSV